MRRTSGILLVLACFLSLGMGSMGGKDYVGDIPEPDRGFKAEVVDATDTSFMVEKLSVEGLTHVPVELGLADISLDFAEISEARFYVQGGEVQARVLFTGGREHTVRLHPDLKFYGRSEWGNMRLKAKDIKLIRFIRSNN